MKYIKWFIGMTIMYLIITSPLWLLGPIGMIISTIIAISAGLESADIATEKDSE